MTPTRTWTHDAARTTRYVAVAVTTCVTACHIACRSDKPQRAAAQPERFPIESIGPFHQANGHLEMNQYDKAADILARLMTATHDDPAVVANLAIASFGQQNMDRAIELARRAAAAAPDHVDIALVLASVLLATGATDEASAVLRNAVRLDPADPRARWRLIVALRSHGGDDVADELADAYEHLLRTVPHNIVALLETARARARRGDLPGALTCANRFLAIVGEPPPQVRAKFHALRDAVSGGESARVVATLTMTQNVMRRTDRFRADMLTLGQVGAGLPDPIAQPVRPLAADPAGAVHATIRFEDATDALGLAGATDRGAPTGVALGTVSDDRAPALYMTFADRPGRLFARQADRFADMTRALHLDAAPPARSARFVDVNNDRRMDLYVCGIAGDRLYIHTQDRGFIDATTERGFDRAVSVGAVAFDFDNDGDLDLLRWDAARVYVHRNDGEGTFQRIDDVPGLPAAIPGITAITTIDLDDDGDVDLGIWTAHDGPKLRVLSNERLGRFRDVTDTMGLTDRRLTSAPAIFDLDNDGAWDIPDLRAGRILRVGPDFTLTDMPAPWSPDDTAVSAAVLDVDCDGTLDIIRVRADGSTSADGVTVPPGDRLLPIDLDGNGAVDLLSTSGVALLNKSHGVGHWLSVRLAARIKGDSRFNAFSLGSTVEIRAGPLYQKRTVTEPWIHFGLGPYTHADVMRVVWPNGSYQNIAYRAFDRMNLTADQVVLEQQTLKGSCPYLYAWNGQRFVFVTDVLWRSALGMAIMADVYAHHHTADDYFKIPGHMLQPQDGAYVLSFTEELWEAAYFDYVRLFVVDHPMGTDIYVDEKCITPPYPPHKIYSVAHGETPRSAVDQDGTDLRDLIQRPDGRYITGFTETRYQGLVNDHDLTLDLGPFDANTEVVLFLSGWIWPTDASINVAASQNPTVDAQPPSLSVIDRDGRWTTAVEHMGFPSGKNKTIVVELTGRFPTDDHRVRISTNFAIFWDHVFFTTGPQNVPTHITELPVAAADLHR
ncbi:MAG: FG-GAP-like repeat-containing protein, partial [Phycisphaerae bacterium]